MIDIHSHILPGLDHGPATWEESLNMARLAVSDGISDLVATPHINYEFRNEEDLIRERVRQFRDLLQRESIPLTVHVGGDYLLTPELLFDKEKIITLGDNGRYFLLEFPEMIVPPNIKEVLKILIGRGLTPIITHPERNQYLQHRPGLLQEMLECGCLAQVTGDSLCGFFGEPVRLSAESMVKGGLIHVLASDAHWEKRRPPILTPSLSILSDIVGGKTARKMVDENPARILAGEDLC